MPVTLDDDLGLIGSVPGHPLPGIARDSRRVAAGDAYVALGSEAVRSDHIAEARARGASTVIAATPGPGVDATASDARWLFATLSSRAAGLAQRCPPLVAATGTKGKSTIAHCAWWAMSPEQGRAAARVGTIGWHDGLHERSNPQTTPPPEELHAFLAALPSACPGVALEISSHGCDQQRLAGLTVQGLAFSGLGHDHLDYHITQAAYLAAKLRATRWLAKGGSCIVNTDDAHGHVYAHAARAAGATVIGLGHHLGEARLIPRVATQAGRYAWRLTWRGASHDLVLPLPGAFNAWNAAAGAFLAQAAGIDLRTAIARLARLPAIPGRLERLAEAPTTYVDYAHTPESIAAVLAALRTAHPGKRLGIVFGCGGDRDRSKRAPMGAAAVAAADVVVLTTDNSRSEDPAAIASDILAGVPSQRSGDVLCEHDRAAAIRAARTRIGRDGVVVVAGKGHETTQIIGDRCLPFDDRAFVASLGDAV